MATGAEPSVIASAKKSTLRTYELICFYFIWLADEDDLMALIKKLNSQDA